MRRREESAEQSANDELLEQFSREELISLIKKMLHREPELETLLLTARKPEGAVTSQKYQRLVDRVFRSTGHEWGAAQEIAEELDSIKETADTFVEQGAYADAVTIYEVIVHTLLDKIYDYNDALHEGYFHALIRECNEQLRTCLDRVKSDRELRERILRLLFDVYQFDVKAGGIGLGEDAPAIMLEHTTAEERHLIATWVRRAIAANGENDWSSKFSKEWLGGFLLELEADILDNEAYLLITRETGRIGDTVDRLLELGRLDEGIKEAQQAGDYDLMALADVFVRHGHDAEAEALIKERAATSSDTRLLDWLKKFYLAHNDKAKALDIAVKLFSKQPPVLAYYQEIRVLAKVLNRWDNLRPRLIEQLKKAKQTHLLIQIALDEKDVEEALVLYKTDLAQGNVGGFGYGYNSLYSGPTLDIEIAQAAEEQFPRNAIEIYQNRIDKLINQRAREYYKQAAQYLLQVRDLYNKIGESERWTTYITSLREKNRALRALKEEMQAVGLI